MNCSRRRFKSRYRLPVWNPEGFRSDSIPGLEHPPGTIWYLKCTNRLRGWFESSYWEYRIFSHMRSCQCKNYIFWTTGTQVMIFISNLSKILDEKFHISQTTPVWESKFFTYERDTKEIFSIKKLAYKSTWNNIRNSAPKKFSLQVRSLSCVKMLLFLLLRGRTWISGKIAF